LQSVDAGCRRQGDPHEGAAKRLTVTFAGSTATVYGVADTQATKERIARCCGNVQGVATVNNQMTVDQRAPEAQYYTVVKGDKLSKFSKQY